MAEDHVYVAGDYISSAVKKYLKSDLSFVTQGPTLLMLGTKLVQDDDYVYFSGNLSPYTIVKYLKSDMSFVTESPGHGSNILCLAADDTHVYASGNLRKVRKYLKSDMSYVGETGAVSDPITSVVVDDDHLYVAELGIPAQRVVRKYLKSTMGYVGQSDAISAYRLAVDATHLYAYRYSTFMIRKYLKSDLSYITESPSYGDDVRAIVADGDYIYAGGDTFPGAVRIKRYLKSDMSFFDESPDVGNYILDMVTDETHIYVVGNSQTVRKYLKSDLSFVTESPNYGGITYCIAHDMWGTSAVLSAVLTGAVTAGPVTATLNGNLTDDGGENCDCGFEWGETPAYGNTTPTDSKATGENFAQAIGGLVAGQTYYYRAVATNGAGTSYGIGRAFVTMNVETLAPTGLSTGDDPPPLDNGEYMF